MGSASSSMEPTLTRCSDSAPRLCGRSSGRLTDPHIVGYSPTPSTLIPGSPSAPTRPKKRGGYSRQFWKAGRKATHRSKSTKQAPTAPNRWCASRRARRNSQVYPRWLQKNELRVARSISPSTLRAQAANRPGDRDRHRPGKHIMDGVWDVRVVARQYRQNFGWQRVLLWYYRDWRAAALRDAVQPV